MFLLQNSIWQKLVQFDQWLFLRINNDLTNPVFDVALPFMRTSLHWAPLYAFIIIFVLLNFKGKGVWWVVFFLATVALTDMTGNYGFKHGFERLRPCNDPNFFYRVRLLVNQCSGGYSFTSNHAANHFAMATFFFFTFRGFLKKWALLGFVWAGIVGYAQIYVGVHYPIDVLAGSLLGIFFGGITATFFNKRYGIAIFDNKPTLSS